MPIHIKLYGGKEDRFGEIKEHLSQEMGYEPTNPEVVGFLMALYYEDGDPLSTIQE